MGLYDSFMYEEMLKRAMSEFVKIVTHNNPIKAAAKLSPYHLSSMTIKFAGIKPNDVVYFIEENFEEAQREWKWVEKKEEPSLNWFDKLIYKKSRHKEILEERKNNNEELYRKRKHRYLYWKILKDEFERRKELLQDAIEKDKLGYYSQFSSSLRNGSIHCIKRDNYEDLFADPSMSFRFIEDEDGRAIGIEKKY